MYRSSFLGCREKPIIHLHLEPRGRVCCVDHWGIQGPPRVLSNQLCVHYTVAKSMGRCHRQRIQVLLLLLAAPPSPGRELIVIFRALEPESFCTVMASNKQSANVSYTYCLILPDNLFWGGCEPRTGDRPCLAQVTGGGSYHSTLTFTIQGNH